MRLYSSRPDRYIIQFGQRLDGCTAQEMNCGGCSCLAVFLYRGCMYVCRYALHMYDKRVASSFIKLSYSLAPHFFLPPTFHQGRKLVQLDQIRLDPEAKIHGSIVVEQFSWFYEKIQPDWAVKEVGRISTLRHVCCTTRNFQCHTIG